MQGFSYRFLGAALGAAFMLCAGSAPAADDAPAGPITFTKDVLPVLQENCQACHRHGGDNYTGMVAPMSLVTYDEVRPWAKAIAREVEAKRMPPWKASPDFHGVFQNERTLTDSEIATLVKWSQSGAQRGRLEDAPEALTFPDTGGWRIGEPDLIVKFEKPYLVGDDVEDIYANVSVKLTEEMLPESRWIKAIEWRGGSDTVHHIVGFASMPGTDAGSRGAGYGLGSIAPGEEPMSFPEGYAKILGKGSTIIFSMHYHKEPGPGTAVEDVSMVAFKFHPNDAEINHFVEHGAIGNGSFELPPNNANWRVGASRIFDEATSVLALHPHMHLRGKDAKYVAFYPDGTQELLLSVPNWDFNWQTDYTFKSPKRIPAGTRIEYTAHFDNSSNNPANPNPNVPIRTGQRTVDEMMLGYITYTKTEPKVLDLTSAAELVAGVQ